MQSEFLKDLSNMEGTVFRVNKSKMRAIILLVVVCLVVVAEAFLVPEGAFYITAMLTTVLLAPYPVLLLIGVWQTTRRRLQLQFMHEERVTQSNQIRRYEKHEFIPTESVKESDPI